MSEFGIYGVGGVDFGYLSIEGVDYHHQFSTNLCLDSIILPLSFFLSLLSCLYRFLEPSCHDSHLHILFAPCFFILDTGILSNKIT